MKYRGYCLIGLILMLGLTACSRGAVTPSGGGLSHSSAENAIPFEPFYTACSLTETELLCQGVEADLSRTADGYVGFRIRSDRKIVIQVIFGEKKYNYTVPVDGSDVYLPLQFGDGSYKLRVMGNTVDNKYIELASRELSVTLAEEFGPFLRPNVIVNYDADSACVKKAAELAVGAEDELSYVKKVYQFVTKTISYDNAFARTVQEGYIPDPDRTLETKKGICFDYSALAAAMFRSQGIPAKVITGYVGKDALYHAWNCIYIRGTGWVTVELKVKTEDWYRVDTTMESAGELTDPSYVDRYVY